MKNNGFTLIELLAVIVILAIIALIATPIILGIIRDAREQSGVRSAELYLKTAQLSLAKESLTNDSSNMNCTILDGGNLNCGGDNNISVDMNNSKTIEGGSLTLTNGKVTSYRVTISGKTYKLDNNGKIVLADNTNISGVCTLKDNDGDGKASLSDEITCDTESFYVMENDGNTITMLSKYNLDVGNTVTDCDEAHNWACTITPISNPTGLQKAEARGYVDGESELYGTIAFSSGNYWWDNENSKLKTDYPSTSTLEGYGDIAYIYDSNSNLYNYVNEYASKLKEKGVSSATATLMSYEDATKLGCSVNDNETWGWCSAKDNNGNSTKGTAPEWLYSTTYWLGSSKSDGYGSVWYVYSNGRFGRDLFVIVNYEGVRPVVKISTSEI